MQKYEVGFLNTHPIQYFAPLYAYLNAESDLNISAFYLSDYSIRGATDAAFGQSVKWDIDLLSGYSPIFVEGADRRNQMHGFLSAVAPGLWPQIRAAKLDALIVHGHTPAAMLVGIAAAKSAGIPVFMRGETHLGLDRSRSKALLRRPVMGALYGRLAGAMAIGSANREFYRAMGVAERRIFSMPYTVDNARFAEACRLHEGERAAIRASFGVYDEAPIVLYAAKFQARKRPGDLIQAAARLAGNEAQFHLVMVGSGELESALKSQAAALGLGNVHFPGFVNQGALPGVYAACDVFVLPSENEPWGLAVNEAMCAGLPIVASREIGCVPDLVDDGRNGLTFDAGNIEELAAALKKLIANPELRRSMGNESRAIIAGWSYAECREGLLQALESIGHRQHS